MEKINDGGPAFPQALAVTKDRDGYESVMDSQDRCVGGMSIRDYFAAKAMNGLISDSTVKDTPDRIAKGAYAVADAMIRAREKSGS